MSSTPNGAATIGGADAPPNTLTLGGRTVTIERPSSLKASRALAMMRGLSNAAPAPNPDGGVTEIPLAGTMRPVAGQPAYTVDVLTDALTTAFTT